MTPRVTVMAMALVVVLFPIALTGGWRAWFVVPCLVAALMALIGAVRTWRAHTK